MGGDALRTWNLKSKVRGDNICPACGSVLVFKHHENRICHELASDWDLSDDELAFFSRREGDSCASCGLSARLLTFSEALLNTANKMLEVECKSFFRLIKNRKFRNLKIANISGCGMISPLLNRKCRNLSYSEYLPEDPRVHHEDMAHLTYEDKSFDFVVNSDVLEHVYEYKKALIEVSRVLKDEGYFIFTVPVIWGRRTKNRAMMKEEKVVHLESPSYHGKYVLKKDDYLVFWEFGDDFIDDLKSVFKFVEVFRREGGEPLMCAFICGNNFCVDGD